MAGEIQPVVVEAAGGVLWRGPAADAELAVIHRPRHRDWSLPKGKRDPGESWQQTALREVLEETGCRAELGPFAGGTIYLLNGKPKVVLFWHMTVAEELPFTPNQEVDRLEWLPLEAALERLDHATERDLIRPGRPAGAAEVP